MVEQIKCKMVTRHPLSKILNSHRLILGSQSPRRVQLLKELGLTFEIRRPDADERVPDQFPVEKVSAYLAEVKRQALLPTLQPKEILLTADTVVLLGETLIGKPTSIDHAQEILYKLSGNVHQVMTSFTLTWGDAPTTPLCGTEVTEVAFTTLTKEEIAYYTDQYQVLDKAGAYGVQEWIGVVGVEAIHGSYTNVMGLPTQLLYKTIKEKVTEREHSKE